MNGYEVTVEDLRRTAGKYDALHEDLGSSKMPDTALGPERVGHTEVASWLKDVLRDARDAHRELGDGLDRLAEFLRRKALDYEQADQDSADRMKPGTLFDGSGPYVWTPGHGSGNVVTLPGQWTPGQAPGNMQPLPGTWPKGE